MSTTVQNARDKSRLRTKLALLLASIIITLLVLEVALRLVGVGGMVVYTPDPDYGYLMTPTQRVYAYGHPVCINSFGFRGPEVQVPKPRDSTRIVFIGDSVTYGGGRVSEEELFCRIVASLARRDGRNVNTVNLSAPGWSPQNWWRYINKHGLHDADVVVLVLPECDLGRPFRTIDEGFEVHASPLRCGNLFLKTKEMAQQQLWSRHAQPEDASRSLEAAAANLAAVTGLREKAAQGTFLAVLIPSGNHHGYAMFWPEFERKLCRPLDLRGDLRDQSLFLDGVHLNARGHELVAGSIYARLRDSL